MAAMQLSSLPLLSSSFFSSSSFLLNSKAFTSLAREALSPPRSSMMEEFSLPDAPLEPTLPKFHRLPCTESLSPVPASPDSEPLPMSRRKRRGRSYKASPWQTIPGALIGGLCALATFKGCFSAYSQLTLHPLAHNLPFGLAGEVNGFLLMMVIWFGGLAVCMFGVSSVGLTLLSVKLLSQGKPPS